MKYLATIEEFALDWLSATELGNTILFFFSLNKTHINDA